MQPCGQIAAQAPHPVQASGAPLGIDGVSDFIQETRPICPVRDSSGQDKKRARPPICGIILPDLPVLASLSNTAIGLTHHAEETANILAKECLFVRVEGD